MVANSMHILACFVLVLVFVIIVIVGDQLANGHHT
jgi:hypothetical protein